MVAGSRTKPPQKNEVSYRCGWFPVQNTLWNYRPVSTVVASSRTKRSMKYRRGWFPYGYSSVVAGYRGKKCVRHRGAGTRGKTPNTKNRYRGLPVLEISSCDPARLSFLCRFPCNRCCSGQNIHHIEGCANVRHLQHRDQVHGSRGKGNT